MPNSQLNFLYLIIITEFYSIILPFNTMVSNVSYFTVILGSISGGSFCEVRRLVHDTSTTYAYLAKATVATHYW